MSSRRDFDGRALVAGSFIGLRVFQIRRGDSLAGAVFPAPFGPGENAAVCAATTTDVLSEWSAGGLELLQLAFTVMYQGQNRAIAQAQSRRGWFGRRPPHTIAGVGCACGFWAYTDGTNEYAEGGSFAIVRPHVEALIEGYGVCTVGDRGFRASKARLIALIDPPAQVVEKYAGVPVYGTRAAALEAHPLTSVSAA